MALIPCLPHRIGITALGVDHLLVQESLRCGNVAVTRYHYVETMSEQSVAAVSKLEVAFGAFCADRALTAAAIKGTRPN